MRMKLENSFGPNGINLRFFRWIGLMIIFLFSATALPVLGADCDINGDSRIDETDAQLCLELYLNVCPTSFATPCSELSCDVNGDGQTTPADAQQISWHYLGRESLCEDMTLCNQCRAKQDKAKDALYIIIMSMETFFAENNYFPSSLGEMGIIIDYTADYTYEIQSSLDPNTFSYQATARSKSPGIMGGGEADDIWISTAANSTLTVTNEKDGCASCPPASWEPCERCRDRQIEAKLSLGTIAKSQEAYLAEYDTYADTLEKIGFRPREENLYHYSLSNVSDSTFLATASSMEPGIMDKGAEDDVWTIDQNRDLNHLVLACPECPKSVNIPDSTECNICRSLQTQAIHQMSLIRDKLLSFYDNNGYYTESLSEIGYEVNPHDRHTYTISADNSSTTKSFLITAQSKEPGIMNWGAGDNIWTMNQDGKVEMVLNPCPNCPRNEVFFPGYECKRRQSEAKQTLWTIKRKQDVYFSENDTYADSIEQLGFQLNNPEESRYQYSISLSDPASYTATATSKAPGIWNGGTGDDVWTIDQNLLLQNPVNGCSW